MQGLDAHERTLYIGTFTKSLFAGLRIGYLVLPPSLVEPMTIARSLQDGHTASIAQLTLARFITGGHFGAYVRAMRNLYAERLELLADLLEQRLGGALQPRRPAGGLQMPCLLSGEMTERAVLGAARTAGIELLGLSGLFVTRPPQPGFLMGFAAYTPQELQRAVDDLARGLEMLKPAAPRPR